MTDSINFRVPKVLENAGNLFKSRNSKALPTDELRVSYVLPFVPSSSDFEILHVHLSACCLLEDHPYPAIHASMAYKCSLHLKEG